MKNLNEIKTRLEKATPGPWETYDSSYMSTYSWIDEWYVENAEARIEGENRINNANFIAHTPEDVSQLIARVEKLENALNEIDRFKDGNALRYVQDIKSIARTALAEEDVE